MLIIFWCLFYVIFTVSPPSLWCTMIFATFYEIFSFWLFILEMLWCGTVVCSLLIHVLYSHIMWRFLLLFFFFLFPLEENEDCHGFCQFLSMRFAWEFHSRVVHFFFHWHWQRFAISIFFVCLFFQYENKKRINNI